MEVNKFVNKITIGFICFSTFISAIIWFSNYHIVKQNFSANEVEANLFTLKENEKFDKLILGISHARNFSRGTHHDLFEASKGKTINLAIGENLNGLEIQKLYAEYFFSKNNNADSLYFILSPTLFYSNEADRSDIAFYKEPIRLDFIFHIMKFGNSRRLYQTFHYLKSKLSHHWWLQRHLPVTENKNLLVKIDSSGVQEGFRIAYPNGLDTNVFIKRCKEFEKIITLFNNNNVGIKIIIPPASFGKWPGHDQLIQYLQSHNHSFVDLSESIMDPKYYYDHHHLNTEGIRLSLKIL